MATVTLPGGNGNFTSIAVNQDAKTALTTAIKNLFHAAGSNITANEIASGVNGDKGFFNLVIDGGLHATTITAGANVEALFDTGLGQDTLIGNKSTTLFTANNAGDSISSIATSTIIGGTGNDTVSVVGKASAYLEAGNNLVQLSNGSVSLLGTGGNDTVNVLSGANTVSATYKATVDLTGSGTTDHLTLAARSTVGVAGNNINATITGNNETIRVTGSNEHIQLIGTGDTIIISGGTNDTITYAAPGKQSGHGAATQIGGGHTGTGQSGHKTTSVAGSGAGSTLHGGSASFVHHIGAHDVYTAGQHSDTMAGALTDKTGGDLFKFDASTHSSHMITAFSSQRDTISIAHADRTQVADALKHATITGSGAHTTTMFGLDNTKITIVGDRVLASDIKTHNG
jgi:Ca2+-binding RTX toxin-like protein